MQCIKRATLLAGEKFRVSSSTLWQQAGLPQLGLVAAAQQSSLHTSAPVNRIPPTDTRKWATYYLQKIQIQQAKGTGIPRPKAHQFKKLPRTFNVRQIPEEAEALAAHEKLAPEVIGAINEQLAEGRQGRLFAGLRVAGKEYHVKTEDLVVVQGRWAPQAGELIRLEKVLYVGGRDFTLFGRPLLPLDQVCVEATVVEKTLGNTTIWFQNRPHRWDRKFRFLRSHHTLLRINCVSMLNKVDQLPEVQGVEGRVFGNQD